MKDLMKIMTQMMKKKREDMFKKHNFKILQCNPNDPNFSLFKFLRKINLQISITRKKCSK